VIGVNAPIVAKAANAKFVAKVLKMRNKKKPNETYSVFKFFWLVARQELKILAQRLFPFWKQPVNLGWTSLDKYLQRLTICKNCKKISGNPPYEKCKACGCFLRLAASDANADCELNKWMILEREF